VRTLILATLLPIALHYEQEHHRQCTQNP